MDYSDYTGFFF